jgi:dihydroxyacid dehydratase/phosphogluconate dehydratase
MVNEQTLAARPAAEKSHNDSFGCGREMFSVFRQNVSDAASGASVLGSLADEN